MIQIIKKTECCGCNACIAICPKKCISKEIDEEGFWYPNVDTNICIECGQCENVCPLIAAEKTIQRYDIPLVYAAYNKNHDIRIDSTSGGLFSAFAENIFEKSGYVGGAIYNPDYTVSHILTDDSSRLPEIRSSKYLQSDMGALYPDLKKQLQSGKKVLVCAAPCQIHALYKYLKKDYENLVTCDFICRGVNSPKVFLSYMNMLERQFGSKATKIKFKAKQWGWHNFSMRVNFANGKEYCKDRWHDLFFIGYLQNGNFARPSCYDCRFKGFPQKADITLADFWGIEKIDTTMDQDCGTSLVMINSDKGRNLFESISSKIVFKEFTMEQAAVCNPAMKTSLTAADGRRKDFFEAIDSMSFENVAKRFFVIPSWKQSIKTKLKKVLRLLMFISNTVIKLKFSLSSWSLFISCNFLNNRVTRTKKVPFHNMKYCRVQLDKKSNLQLNADFVMGYQQVLSSHKETRLLLEESAQLIVNGNFIMYSDSYIRVIKGGILELKGGFINEGCQITCASKIVIGKDCVIARDVVIRDYDGHFIDELGYQIAKPIVIGNHVWIGNKAMILKGVSIGDGAIVAAGSIVTKNIPPYSVAAGVPARVVKQNVKWH